MKRINDERVDGGSSIYARDIVLYYKTISLKSKIMLGDKFWHINLACDDAIPSLSRYLTGYNNNAFFSFTGSAHQNRSAGSHQGHGCHGGKYSIRQRRCCSLIILLGSSTIRELLASLHYCGTNYSRDHLGSAKGFVR